MKNCAAVGHARFHQPWPPERKSARLYRGGGELASWGQRSQSSSQAQPSSAQKYFEVARATAAEAAPITAQGTCRKTPAASAMISPSGANTRVPVNRAATPKTTARLPRIGGCHGAAGAVVATVMMGACIGWGSAGSGGVAGTGTASWFVG